MSPRPTVLCVDDEKLVLDALKEQLRRAIGGEVRVESAECAEEALEVLAELIADGVDVPVIVSDHLMPGLRGADLLIRIHAAHPRVVKVLLTGQADADAVGRAVNRAGLYRYIAKPWAEDDLVLTVREAVRRYFTDARLEAQNARLEALNQDLRAALSEVERLKDRLAADNAYLREAIDEVAGAGELVGESAALRGGLEQVALVAETDANVLITGESGTGKELIARAIHRRSRRRERPLVKVNCAALPATLIESELFGHEKGAFTGATARRAGRFELAHEGTIFLDELGELPLELQPKLLRVLQEGEFDRLGSSGKTQRVDTRVIAATNQDLLARVKEGRFRADLYYRLAVFPVALPPLRERPEDIPLLARHFLARSARAVGRPVRHIPEAALARLTRYPWPGNVRELDNVISRAVILSNGDTLAVDGLLPAESSGRAPSPPAAAGAPEPVTIEPLATMERRLIRAALDACDGVVAGREGAARLLDIPAITLRDRIRRYGL